MARVGDAPHPWKAKSEKPVIPSVHGAVSVAEPAGPMMEDRDHPGGAVAPNDRQGGQAIGLVADFRPQRAVLQSLPADPQQPAAVVGGSVDIGVIDQSAEEVMRNPALVGANGGVAR
jgi:hypothetical protein